MKILEFKDKKVKFKSKKENEVLVDVFFKKSVEDLDKIWINYNFDDIRNNKDWRDYIECKLKVVMGVEKNKDEEEKNNSCFDKNITDFYKENILDKFLKEKWLDQLKDEESLSLDLKNYFYVEQDNIDEEKIDWWYMNFLKIDKNILSKDITRTLKGRFDIYMDKEISFKCENWFFYYQDEEKDILIIYKYRLPIDDINTKFIVNEENFFFSRDRLAKEEDLIFFLLTKVDLTQDIQEIKISSNIKIPDNKIDDDKIDDNIPF